MWSWSQSTEPIQMADGTHTFRKADQQRLPFANGLRLPGTTIRGVLRTIVEIIGDAPLDPVNDRRYSYRTVADVPNPARRNGSPNPNFDPLAPRYKAIMKQVKAGYLNRQSPQGSWNITPSVRNGKYYRVTDDSTFQRKLVEFDDRTAVPGAYGQADAIPAGKWQLKTNITAAGWKHGWLIASRPMENKTHNWIIGAPDLLKKIQVSPDDRKLHEEAGISGWIDEAIEKKEFDLQAGIPCFFSICTLNGQPHTFIGPTRNFRVPYLRRLGEAIPVSMRRPNPCPQWDLAQAIFGRTTRSAGEPGARTRIFVEDAKCLGSVAPALRGEKTIVPGDPKPTTFQHYVVQTSDDLAKSITWDNNDAVARGHKLYWHRPGADGQIREAGGRQLERGTATTTFAPTASGAIFAVRVRFENLRAYELGAVLTAIDLPQGCAHHLGMGKPLGLGSFKFKNVQLQVFDFKNRYSSFFDNEVSLAIGVIRPSPTIDGFKEQFANWYLNKPGDLWILPRFQELKALLTWNPPVDAAQWLSITRYLEFGRVAGEAYNEYLATEPPPSTEKDKRRPLPPPLQVREAGSAIPRDPRPDFEEP
jgi:CRISPR-associated protein (TIGR03986 family)